MAECTNDDPIRCPLSEAAAKSAVKQVFAILGVDVDDPKDVEEFRKDLRFGQSMRRASDKGVLAVVSLVFVGLAVSIWTGVKISLGGH